MGRPPRWKTETNVGGIKTYTLSSWKYFHDFLQETVLDYKNYVFRGQSNSEWKLEPTIHRYYKRSGIKNYKNINKEHLENFKFSLRGRTSILKDVINDDNELWSLGQHHGLATPFLDFSFSPYVAAYFAFYEENTESGYRTIYGLSQKAIYDSLNDELEIYKPISDHNPRLINQSGLFIKFDTEFDIEDLLKNEFKTAQKTVKLFKINIPNKDRELCLKLLNKMNINHNTLFPDLTGTSIYCNMQLEIKKY